jgi:hypothetical protein
MLGNACVVIGPVVTSSDFVCAVGRLSYLYAVGHWLTLKYLQDRTVVGERRPLEKCKVGRCGLKRWK